MNLELLGKTTTLTQGWNRLGERYGVKVFGDDLLLINCGGILRFNSLKLNGKELTDVPESLPPRAGLVIRGKPARLVAPSTFSVGRMKVPYAPILRNAPKHKLTKLSPLWTVAGDMQADAPGAADIEPYAGYSQDFAWIRDYADALMARNPLFWLDMQTGEPPRFVDQKITDAVGWAKETQIAGVCQVNPDPYDDSRKPLEANAPNGCTYEHDLLGFDRNNSWIAFDGEHRWGRLHAQVKAAAECGDPVAAFYLKVIAADAAYTHQVYDFANPGKGSPGYYGRRNVAGGIMERIGSYFSFADEIAAYTVCRLPTKGWMNSPPGVVGFSPNPWDDRGVDRHYNVDATLERSITLHMMAMLGRTRELYEGLAAVFNSPVISVGYVPKFLIVAKYGVPVSQLVEGAGERSYFDWLPLGDYAAQLINVPLSDPRWHELERWICSIPTPEGKRATSLKDLRDRLRKEELGRGLCVPMLSVLEAMPL